MIKLKIIDSNVHAGKFKQAEFTRSKFARITYEPKKIDINIKNKKWVEQIGFRADDSDPLTILIKRI